MAGYVNKVMLLGRLGRDPETRTTTAGKVTTFSLATSESWNDKASGEKKVKTQWHRIVIFNERTGETAERYLKKGNMVHIEGQLESRKYKDKDQIDRETFEIVIGRFDGKLTLMDNPNGAGSEAGESSPAASRSAPDQDEDVPF